MTYFDCFVAGSWQSGPCTEQFVKEQISTSSRHTAVAEPLKPDGIVTAASGEMAYEYGTSSLSFDEVGSGKHVAFTAAYLRVWRSIDGSGKEVAFMAEPEGNN
jgi:hypothetical protein